MPKRTEHIGAGDLNRRVRFEARAEVDDGHGNEVSGDWMPQFERWAYVAPLKGGENVIAARLQGLGPAIIVLRYDSMTKTIGTSWRAVELRSDGPDVVYAIKDARDMEGRRRHITLMTEAGRPA